MNLVFVLLTCFVIGLSQVSMGQRPGRAGRQQRRNSTDAAAGCPTRSRPCLRDCGSHGFRKNRAGCELCVCNYPTGGSSSRGSPVPDNCPALECPESGVCPRGPRRDEKGCPLCECRPAPRCQQDHVDCGVNCPLGFINGPDGCPTCDCFNSSAYGTQPQPPTRRPLICSLPLPRNRHLRIAAAAASYRPVQYSNDSSALNNGEDNTPVDCPPTCSIKCKHGLKMGNGGCPICECNNPLTGGNRRGNRRLKLLKRRQCLHPVCAMFCPNGFKRNHAGCTLCECHQPRVATV